MTEAKDNFAGAANKRPPQPDVHDIDALIGFAELNNVKSIHRFVEAFGADHLDDYGSTGWTALTRASSRDGDNVVDAVRTLLDYGANIEKGTNFGDNDPWTPLMVAAANFMKDVVELLVERGADPTATNKNGRTARQIHAQRAYRDPDAPVPAEEYYGILPVLDAAAVKWKQAKKPPASPAAPSV